MRMQALKEDLYECWAFLGFVVVCVLLVVCAMVFGLYVVLEDAFRQRKIREKKGAE